jgi:Ca-activated chloride channel family protein
VPAQQQTLERRRAGVNIAGGVRGVDYGLPIDEGRGPGIAGDRFEPITDNPFKRVSEHPLSTFSVDVDTASYSKTRDFLMRANQLPRPDAVRIEELLNYFDYEYDPPSDSDKHPFAARATVTACPWNSQHRLARIALKGKMMEQEDRPPCNLVFLLDTSGSMNAPNKLPLVIEGMQMLLTQLDEKDTVAITVYAGSAGLVLDSTSAKKGKKIRKALTQLSAGGSTNGGAGIALAYQTARDNFIPEGVNRVILCTDGDFNVGTTGTAELVRMVEREAKGGVFLSVLGFGMGNHNDAMLEKISGRGNGNYAFIDNRKEARKVLVDQTSGTLVTIAKDVKLQIDFNLNHVSSYRLIGYENRVLAKEDFNDDKKDAGEIGAGHAVTALYEIVPAGVEADASRPKVDDLKYQTEPEPTEAADSDEMMTLKLRYKQPDGDTSTLVEFPVTDEGGEFKDADHDVRFAAAVASFGMQLRRSEYAGSWTMNDVIRVADDARGEDMDGLRAEFVDLARKAKELMGQE